MDSINCHNQPLGTFHKYRLKFIKDKPVYVCKVCNHHNPMRPSAPIIVSPAMAKIIKELKP